MCVNRQIAKHGIAVKNSEVAVYILAGQSRTTKAPKYRQHMNKGNVRNKNFALLLVSIHFFIAYLILILLLIVTK